MSRCDSCLAVYTRNPTVKDTGRVCVRGGEFVWGCVRDRQGDRKKEGERTVMGFTVIKEICDVV